MLVVETFVDSEQFCGTVYTASNWVELGPTDGWGRRQRDYYVQHDRPKRLFVRALTPNACRSLQAEHLKPALAAVEHKATRACYYKVREIEAITEHFKAVPEYRQRAESYPAWSLLANSLFMEWRRRQAKPQYQTITDFPSAMGEDQLAKALRFVTGKRPKL